MWSFTHGYIKTDEEVNSLHKYMRAIGFSEVWSRKELQKLLTDVVIEGKERAYNSNGDETLLAYRCYGVW